MFHNVIHIKGCLLQVRVSGAQTDYALLHGESLAFSHRGQAVELTQAAASRALA